MSIPMSLTLGLSGQPFNGADIGGYGDKAKPGLFAHWIALGVFYPFSRAHACKDTNNKEPWAFGQKIEKVARIALERRYRLLPYFYTLFYEASSNGMPVMRPVFFADPSNKKLRKEQQAFLLGADLLVIPKWAKKVRIPKGFTQSVSLVGEDTVSDPYQCDLRIRDGAIIPLTRVIQNTTEFDHSSLTLLVRLDKKGKAEGMLYEDDNDGFGYLNGKYRLIKYSAKLKNHSLVITRSRISGELSYKNRVVDIQIINNYQVINKTADDADKISFDLNS